jgi:hypothetical protein
MAAEAPGLSGTGRGSADSMTEKEPKPEPPPDDPATVERVAPDAESDFADEHDSVTVDDGPLDEPAESDARFA